MVESLQFCRSITSDFRLSPVRRSTSFCCLKLLPLRASAEAEEHIREAPSLFRSHFLLIDPGHFSRGFVCTEKCRSFCCQQAGDSFQQQCLKKKCLQGGFGHDSRAPIQPFYFIPPVEARCGGATTAQRDTRCDLCSRSNAPPRRWGTWQTH